MTDIDRHRHGDHDGSATSTIAAEDTPLLHSETSSSLTARDASPPTGPKPVDDSEQPLGWKRTTCIVLSMWVLIFLQGKLVVVTL